MAQERWLYSANREIACMDLRSFRPKVLACVLATIVAVVIIHACSVTTEYVKQHLNPPDKSALRKVSLAARASPIQPSALKFMALAS
jgi:hypothetical protein